ncbi:hypothetical protein PV327_006762 [Microctonus hyperodae]|uniref:Condensin complex subunit 2 n=1 Tax=Microctonus hyperodae TaxID=165561 RepID=A0AA39F544_MICHY|nr:hypothetical protein PV327_006762 [Microctonus hyperodae]
MDRRKSLATPQSEHLRSPGSLRRRSNIPANSAAIGLIDNDDEAERAALRTEANITSTPNPPTSNRRSLSLNSIVGGMSQPQIAEGIAECIKLNLQNKINMKNAFSLNMIDFMSYLVRNRDEGISNLQVAGTSLDVSAKIYALRVDALHQDILKMAGNLDHKDKNDEDNDNEENNDPAVAENDNVQQNNEKIQKKKKKKKSSRKIRTTIDSLIGENDVVCLTPVMFGEADCQTTDMLYQAMLPQHCNVGLGLHPYKDVILDNNSDSMTNSTDIEPRIPWPPVQFDAIRDIITVYPGFEFLNWSNEEEGDNEKSYSQETPSLTHDDLAFDLDASLPPDEPISNGQNFYDINDDNEDNAEGYHAEIRTANAGVGLPNILSRLPDTKLEYSFFSDAVNARWISPGYWKIKSAVKNLGTSKVMEACRQGAGRKKKELELVFNDTTENCDTFLNVSKRSTTKLQTKTVKTVWSEKKLELPTENHDNSMKQVCQYFLRTDIIKFVKNTDMNATELPEESAHYDYGNENDTINYSPNDDDEDAQVNDDIYQDNADNMDVDTGGFMGDNLIEAPKLTQKIFIPFSQRAKKLDMRRLKKCIWNSLLCHDQYDKDKENVNIDDKSHNDVLSVKGEIKFANIVADLPKKLNINDAEELSIATAFVSLLHLANEKCLKVHSNINFSDVIIAQDSL